jgi:transposase-like protein
MDIIEIYERFPTPEDCLTYLEHLRWNGNPQCPYCESRNFTKLKNETRYHCNKCNTRYSVTVQTTFHKTHVDLQKWFLAIYLLIVERKHLSSRQLAEILQVNKNTAWLMIARIDQAMANKDQRELLMRIVEND